jgi:hypothetical protein
MKSIYVDIDETICTTPGNKNEARDYNNASPIKENIDFFNSLYDLGHEITYWTARGTVSGIDWSEVTKNQFKLWGVKYNSVKFGKPAYDIFVDDKVLNVTNKESIIRFIDD